MALEYRLTWRADTDIRFRGATDWTLWEDGPDATERDISDALQHGGCSDGLQEVLTASGFSWDLKTRVAT